jgi:hypothetical protein
MQSCVVTFVTSVTYKLYSIVLQAMNNQCMHIFHFVFWYLWLGQIPLVLMGYGAFRIGEIRLEMKARNDETLCSSVNG